jgi:hypothetical protein
MTTETATVVIEHLRKIRAELSEIKADAHDLKLRTSANGATGHQ